MSNWDDDKASTIRPVSENTSDSDGDEEDHYLQDGDYSRRIDEILSDGEAEDGDEDEDDSDSEFVYTGIDAQLSSETYRDQLKDVLGPDHDDDDANEMDTSLVAESEKLALSDDAQVSVMAMHCRMEASTLTRCTVQ
jgi:hypothetical protein